MSDDEAKDRKFGSVSLPTGILEGIDDLIAELHYWPSRSSFVREACLEKMRREEDRLRDVKASASRLSPTGLPAEEGATRERDRSAARTNRQQ